MLVYFTTIWHFCGTFMADWLVFLLPCGIWFPILVWRTKKNLATLTQSTAHCKVEKISRGLVVSSPLAELWVVRSNPLPKGIPYL
jgi:hypothetical protein